MKVDPGMMEMRILSGRECRGDGAADGAVLQRTLAKSRFWNGVSSPLSQRLAVYTYKSFDHAPLGPGAATEVEDL